MATLTQILLLAVLIEAVVDWVKNFVNARFPYQQAVAFVAALIFAAGMNLNFFALVGLDYRWPVVGIVFAALVLSRGSNYVQDFWDLVSAWRKK
jgi:hypothetical protein